MEMFHLKLVSYCNKLVFVNHMIGLPRVKVTENFKGRILTHLTEKITM